MSVREYKQYILEALLKKYNRRRAQKISTGRRIMLKPTELYKDYAQNNADMKKKSGLEEALAELHAKGFVTAVYLKFSEDIEKIYLAEDYLKDIEEYLKREYGVLSFDTLADQVRANVKRYTESGDLVQKYVKNLLTELEVPGCLPDPERIEANLKLLDFLEKNKEDLYVRELSVFLYGDSKWFESNNYEEICTFLRSAVDMPKEESEKNDEILPFFHVLPTEQEIFIKGCWELVWEHGTLDVSKLQGGVALTLADLQNIRHIQISGEELLTIENKTSYRRMQGNQRALMYLGGFASRHQIAFLKKLIADKPDLCCRHFGDIDVGGFLIHRHLCREVGRHFALYRMGIPELEDSRFRQALKTLTKHDVARLEALPEEAVYRDVFRYMKEHKVKLEQEMISYYIAKE